MKLIIDIDEELYEAYKNRPPMLGDEGMDKIAQAIANGTPVSNEGDIRQRGESMTRWCDNCKNRETCKKYKEEMQSPMSRFFQGCLGGYEEDKSKAVKV